MGAKAIILFCKSFRLRLEILSALHPKQPVTVISEFELFSALRKKSAATVLIVPDVKCDVEKVLFKIESEFVESIQVGILSEHKIKVIEKYSYLTGPNWKEYFEHWFQDFSSGKRSKIRSSNKIGLNSPIGLLKDTIRMLRRRE